VTNAGKFFYQLKKSGKFFDQLKKAGKFFDQLKKAGKFFDQLNKLFILLKNLFTAFTNEVLRVLIYKIRNKLKYQPDTKSG
jgi:hypothetical protein